MIGGQGNDLETLWLYETVHPFSFIRSSTLFEKAPLRSKILTIFKRLCLLLKSGFLIRSPQNLDILKEAK